MTTADQVGIPAASGYRPGMPSRLLAPEGVPAVVEEFEHGGATLVVETFGEGRPFVLLHGIGMGRSVYLDLTSRLRGTVVAVDIAKDRLDELAAEFDGVTTVVGDITKPEDVARIVAATNGTVHGLANIAGVMDDMTPLHEVTDAVWERVFAVNVDGMFRLTRAVLPLMLEAGYGSVVNVTSEAGLRGSAAGLAYTASKHAVVGMTKSSAFMYTLSGVRFNAVAPGPVMTNIEGTFNSELGKERLGGYMQLIPPVAEASQLASSISYLLSDDGSNISGAILPSDGGWSAA